MNRLNQSYESDATAKDWHAFGVEIRRLAAATSDVWQKCGFERAAFPEIAAQQLRNANLSQFFSEEMVLRALWESKAWPSQLDPGAGFGQPPLTILRTAKFLLDLYFWTDIDISIHDHSFVGGFANLVGESLNCVYDFQTHSDDRASVQCGQLRLNATSVLSPGSVCPIAEGKAFVHRVWHLDVPTITIALRTYDPAEERSPYSYLPPGLAWQYTKFGSAVSRRRRQFLKYLFARRHPRRLDLARQLVEYSPPLQALLSFLVTSSLCDEDDWYNLVRMLEGSEQSWLPMAIRAISETQVRAAVRWGRLKNKEHRRVVAALLSCETRSELLHFLRVTSVKDVCSLVEELSTSGVLAQRLSSSEVQSLKVLADSSDGGPGGLDNSQTLEEKLDANLRERPVLGALLRL